MTDVPRGSPSPWRVDAHRHYWDPRVQRYDWMPRGSVLDRPYLPPDVHAADQNAGIAGAVVVQAAADIVESRLLAEWASADPSIVGIVGWVDLASRHVEAQLDSIPSDVLVGVRAMLQDIPDVSWVSSPRIVSGLRVLARRGLPFEVVLYPRHLPGLIEAVEQVPELRVVVDHLAKPRYGMLDSQWTSDIDTLSRRENCAMKISGLATELADPRDTRALRPHVEFALERFGSARCMMGTDWPVSLLAAPFSSIVDQLDELIAQCSPTEIQNLWRETAIETYGLALNG